MRALGLAVAAVGALLVVPCSAAPRGADAAEAVPESATGKATGGAAGKASAKVKPKKKPDADDAVSPDLKEKIAAFALRQVAFGSVSILPVRFESARLAGPFEDGGRRLYCVSAQMKGRSFGKAERPKAVIQEDRAAGVLRTIDDDEVCQGHRSAPFPELERLGNGG